MPNPGQAGKDPAEGSRETIEHELKRQDGTAKPAMAGRGGSASGDDALPGTPGTGEDICPECRGSGKIGAATCQNCEGSGRIIKGVGDA